MEHSYTNLIHSLSKEQLINRKRYAEMAVDYWENHDESDVLREFNLEFFRTELDIVNKELSKKF
jgi:hypothetical protein